jgi:nucleotide-binding universal stress UspA family protein
VVVVPAVASLEGRIVVGVDGSAHAVTALRWALTEARRRRVGVEVLYAWQYPAAFLYETAVLGDLDLEPAAAAIVARVLSDVEAEAEGIDVTARTVGGHAVEALVGAADGASLVVVGARGHGAMSGLLLGSVSDGVVRHAPCPVAVIP